MSESARDKPTTGKKGTSLTDRAGRGYVWMLGQTAANQVLNFGGQIALGYLIFKEDFGLYATVQALAMGAAQAHKVGLRAILIRRQARFHLWANPAFWVALTLGIVSMLVLFALTPFAAAIFDEPKITPLIPVIALAMPFISIASIPEARIQAQMRFRLLAASRFLQVSGLLALTVTLAVLGFGVWSFVIPRPIIALLRAAWLFAVTRPPLRPGPQAKRWRFMLRDSWRLAVGNWANYVITQMDYMILAAIHSSNVVGLYFYAFGLSQRAFVVLTMNLRDVLFPALSTLQDDPKRQADAFLRASRMLTMIGAPFCFLQAALAEPAVNLVLDESKWEGLATLVQILSLGTLFRMVGQPSLALLKAQGRFGTFSMISAGVSVLFIVVVIAAAATAPTDQGIQKPAIAVALAVAAVMTVVGPMQMWLAVRHGGRGFIDVINIFWRPMLMSAIAVGAAWWIGEQLPSTIAGRDIYRIAIVCGVAGPLWLAAGMVIARDDLQAVAHRLRSTIARKRK